MFDPEIANSLIGVAECQIVVCLFMGKERRVEIKPETLIFRPIDPWGKVAEFDLIAVRVLVGIQVEGMKVEAVIAGDQAVGKLKVRA